MIQLRPRRVCRDDLLVDRRFWGQLYTSYLEACQGDHFDDGLDYFLSVSSKAAYDYLEELEASPVGDGHFPEVAVTVPLKNHWRAGVILSYYPEDFEIQEVLVSPEGADTVISVSGGTTWLPGLRWQELLAIADAVLPIAPASKEKAILLLYGSVGLTQEVFENEARTVLRNCWQQSGLTIRHVDEFLDRFGGDPSGSRWGWNQRYGWINTTEGSPRNPASRRGALVVPEVKRFFGSLASTFDPCDGPNRVGS